MFSLFCAFSSPFQQDCQPIFFQVRYTGHRDQPLENRRSKFEAECEEGFTEIVSL